MSIPNQSNPQTQLNRILEIISEVEKMSTAGNYIFRGEAELYPKISSNLYRELEKFKLLYLGVEVVQKDELTYAKRYGYTQKTDDFEILTEIQHFGGKTNLLDFTTYYPIALFFACLISPFKDGRIILLDKNGVIKDWIREPCDPDPKSRVRVQKSIFVRPPEGFIEPDEEVIISKDLKQPMLNYLKKEFKISPEEIYPDLHGYVSSQETRWSIYEEYNKGITCLEKGDEVDSPKEKDENYQMAVTHFSNVIQLMPEYSGAYNGRSHAYREIGNLDKAIADADEALHQDPECFRYYFTRGLAYLSKENYDKTISDFRKGLKLNPQYAQGYQILGLIYFSKRDFDNAIANLDKAIHLNPEDTIAYVTRGFAWLHLKMWDKVKIDLNVAKSKGEDITAAFYNKYKSVTDFERIIGTKLPKDIVAMLTQYPVNSFTTTQKIVTHDGKTQESAAVLELLEKFRNAGKPLREYLQEPSSRGITTGYNEAFIVQRETRDALIAEHPSSAEVLKPFLMARDIQRWQVKPTDESRREVQDKWLIWAHRGIDINVYPVIKKHLEKSRDALEKRSGKQEWYELQTVPKGTVTCEQPKCIYADMASETAFAFDDESYYVGSPASLLPTSELWILGVLNTRAVSWFYARTAPQIRGPFLKFTPRYVSQIPIPDMEPEQRALIRKIVEYILYLKKQPTVNSKDLKYARDRGMVGYFGNILNGLVYELYLPDELHRGDKYFFQPLFDEQLPQLEKIQGDKMSSLRDIFEHLYEKTHPVAVDLFFMSSVKPIRIIEGRA
ncbi:MAG: FRG domain-containing protein [Candidatus Poribacteria bacterium]|nr:FRG domain-containing protein [Candidatus Poribacteria bacterium]